MSREYEVLLEQKQGVWQALIPALAGLRAEGESREAAVRNIQRMAEAYVSSIAVTTIRVTLPQELVGQPGSSQKLLQALDVFMGDEEMLREHFDEIALERQHQRQVAQQQDVA